MLTKEKKFVCSFNKSMELQQLGIDPSGSIFCYIFGLDNDNNIIREEGSLYFTNVAYECVRGWLYCLRVPAFTACELGELCPHQMITYYSDHTGFWHWQLLEFNEDSTPVVWASGDEYESEAEARADCLIHSLKNRFMEINDVNEKLKDLWQS